MRGTHTSSETAVQEVLLLPRSARRRNQGIVIRLAFEEEEIRLPK